MILGNGKLHGQATSSKRKHSPVTTGGLEGPSACLWPLSRFEPKSSELINKFAEIQTLNLNQERLRYVVSQIYLGQTQVHFERYISAAGIARSIEARLRAGWSGGRIPVEAIHFTVLQNVRTGPGIYTAS